MYISKNVLMVNRLLLSAGSIVCLHDYFSAAIAKAGIITVVAPGGILLINIFAATVRVVHLTCTGLGCRHSYTFTTLVQCR